MQSEALHVNAVMFSVCWQGLAAVTLLPTIGPGRVAYDELLAWTFTLP